jgi:hypothetical protein
LGMHGGGDESEAGRSSGNGGEHGPTKVTIAMFHGGFWFFEN